MVEKSPLAATATKQTSPPRKQKKQGTKRKIRRARNRRARKQVPKMRKRAKKRSPRKRNKPSGLIKKQPARHFERSENRFLSARPLRGEISLGRLVQRRLKLKSFQVAAKGGAEFRILQSDFNGCF